MKAILTAIGTAGDVLPFIGLGTQLKARGHEVILITHGHFAVPALRAGLGFAPVGMEQQYLDALVLNPLIWDPKDGYGEAVRCAANLVPEVYETVRENIEPGRTIIVAHYLDFASRLIQSSGVPMITALVTPTGFRFAEEYLAQVQLPAPIAALRDGGGPAWSFSSLLTIGLFPSWFAPPEPHWPTQVQLTGFPLYDATEPVPHDVDRFLAEGTPPIVFTPGPRVEMAMSANPEAALRAAIDACERLGQRGLVLGGLRQPPDLPDWMHYARFAPLLDILPRSRALVHHGGIGTIAAGLACGVPQVAQPVCHDQPDNAARLVKLGVGAVLPPAGATDGAALAECLDALLASEAVAERCRNVSARCRRGDGLASTAAVIEYMAPRESWPPIPSSSPSADPSLVQAVPALAGTPGKECG